MGSYFKAIVLLIVLVALVTFGIQNNETLKLHYYFGMHSMALPVYGIVYASILLGIFIGMLIGISTRLSQRKQIKALEKENRNLKSKAAEETPEEQPEKQPEDNTQEMAVPESQFDETLAVNNDSEK
jgi:uncharacterized integral membrane protein